jgi:serine/threonine protein kinase/photosystem II stability/assembly factor-like uncharacterized protein
MRACQRTVDLAGCRLYHGRHQEPYVTDHILGRYRILASLGKGGMGIVYRARDELLARDVAVKVLKRSAGLDPAASNNLLEEARASSSLSHPNICTIYDVGEDSGELYIVMELIEGRSLREMRGDAGLPPELVIRYGIQVASALARAHDRGILHRDLKSENIVVTSEGTAKVLDFGLAMQAGTAAISDATESLALRSEPTAISGTLPYMAPELLRGEAGDYRSDLWALGVVLYETASGRLPFQGNTVFELTSAILRSIAEPLPPPLPPGVWVVIQRCLAKEPAQRYQRAGEIQAALEAVQAAAILSGAPPSGSGALRTTTMHSIRHIPPSSGDRLLLVGTTKGAFILRSGVQRKRWDLGGPYFHGHAVYSLAWDDRAGRQRMWASTQSFWGTTLRWSDDYGRSWTNPQEAPIRFPSDTGASLKNIWQITPGRPDEPEVLYCGVEPAALFESRDAGITWSLQRALWDHPHRPRWRPGNGGLALHTILLDPQDRRRMYIAISSGGVYRTCDGGASWTAQNRGVRVTFTPDRYPEFGQCIHKIAMHPQRPQRLFLQNHWGIYRSDDHAETWTDIANGVPSDFGFAVVVHPAKPDWVYVIPVESDEFRCACEGHLRVYRTRNAGLSWEPLARGLPQKSAYETVLRDAMIADPEPPHSLYFGTRSGQIFSSSDEGRSWERIIEGLPSVLCLRAAAVAGSSAGPASSATLVHGEKPIAARTRRSREPASPAKRH